jgi:hypothetical protein
MMEMSSVLIVVMVVICGGMMAGAVWAMVRGRRDRSDD